MLVRFPLVHAPGLESEGLWNGVALTWAGCGFIAAFCLALSAWRLRPAHELQLAGGRPATGLVANRPPVSNLPVRWKERYLGELAVLPFVGRLPKVARGAWWHSSPGP